MIMPMVVKMVVILIMNNVPHISMTASAFLFWGEVRLIQFC
jgi:hypothetical protein